MSVRSDTFTVAHPGSLCAPLAVYASSATRRRAIACVSPRLAATSLGPASLRVQIWAKAVPLGILATALSCAMYGGYTVTMKEPES